MLHIACHRKLRGLTMAQLAERAGLGVHTVARLETGNEQCTIDTLRKLADALNLPVSALWNITYSPGEEMPA